MYSMYVQDKIRKKKQKKHTTYSTAAAVSLVPASVGGLPLAFESSQPVHVGTRRGDLVSLTRSA
ncbi:hypothetical protein DM02DRAFT_161012 [Periconia macrospinosa]|uniref:Uncharacterized protein n=1 Tax=Periconia macrospinosa TaxID=97972 RepID=A0A2V1E2F1_9PLEO|nr:hypothetical protein DM02DRAFT_161012 [Periconia macrospinosa]